MKRLRLEQLKDDFFSYKEFVDLPKVQEIVNRVKEEGDRALRSFTGQFDNIRIMNFEVKKEDIERAYSEVDKDVISDMKKAVKNLKRFSSKQFELFKEFEFEPEKGILLGQKIIPIERVGIYVPCGRYPLISTLIMGAIPAQTAGVKELVVCSPPSDKGFVNPMILVVADICGVRDIYRVGGAQAIAAMAFGTESIKRVDKIVGPGNNYVSAAKKYVYGSVGIDFIAGPTEVMIIADKEANASYIAADLIAQSEHDENAVPILVTDANDLVEEVEREINRQLMSLKKAKIVRNSLDTNGHIILVDRIEDAVELANRRAPEHLELHIREPEPFIPKLKNYGSLFIGEYSAEALGDYSSGLNHILPTNLASRYSGALSVKNFLKFQTTLKVNERGFKRIAPLAKEIAKAEGLEGHVRSISIREK